MLWQLPCVGYGIKKILYYNYNPFNYYLIEAIYVSSELNLTKLTKLVCTLRICINAPVSTSHNFTEILSNSIKMEKIKKC